MKKIDLIEEISKQSKISRSESQHCVEVVLTELTSAIAWENYRARFDHALKVESQGFSEGEFCPLPV